MFLFVELGEERGDLFTVLLLLVRIMVCLFIFWSDLMENIVLSLIPVYPKGSTVLIFHRIQWFEKEGANFLYYNEIIILFSISLLALKQMSFVSSFVYSMYLSRWHRLMECCGSEFQRLMYRFLVIVYLCFYRNIQHMNYFQSRARFGFIPFFNRLSFCPWDLHIPVNMSSV